MKSWLSDRDSQERAITNPKEKTVEFPTCMKQPGFSVLLRKESHYAWMHTWDSCLRSEKTFRPTTSLAENGNPLLLSTDR